MGAFALKISRPTFLAGGILLVLAAGMRLYLYVVGGATLPVTTDEAMTVLQAEMVLAGKWPLLLMAQPYMFPVEVYWMAPLVGWLPRTAHGMRVLVLLEGVVYTLCVLGLLWSWRDLRREARWAGVLLILFPSVYLVLNQTAYSLPHYNSAFILVLAAVGIERWMERRPDAGWKATLGLAAAAGFFASLAFSNSILSLALVAPFGVIALVNSVGRGRWIRLPGYALGGAAGLIPYVAAMKFFPGANQSVTQMYAWGHAAERIWNPGILHTLPVAFGFTPCYFPDSRERLLEWGAWGGTAFSYLFLPMLLAAVVVCIAGGARRVLIRRELRPGLAEWSLGVTLLSLLLFGLNRRADSASYRYLVPIVVVFPFFFAALVDALPGRIARAGLAVACVWAGYNVATAFRLPEVWKRPHFAREIVSAPDLEPAMKVLDDLGIRHTVASHWAAYRIAFLGDGRVMSTQPMNERFPGWPLPYKREVDAAERVAYVLTEDIRFLKPSIFERHLRTMGVEADVYEAGAFKVYADFRSPRYEDRREVGIADVEPGGGAGHPEQTGRLRDGDERTFWRSGDVQAEGMSLTFEFDRLVERGELEIRYGHFGHDAAPATRVEIRNRGRWRVLTERREREWDKFAWGARHPVYGVDLERVVFPETAEALRLTIVEPREGMHWTLAETTLYDLAGIK